MHTIHLDRLISHREIFSIITDLMTLINSPIAVLDSQSNLLLGEQREDFEKQFAVKRGSDVLGWVHGNEQASLLASFLSFAAMREYEKKALTSEVLESYRDLLHLYGISETLSVSLASDKIAQLAIKEVLSLIKATSASIMLTGDEDGLLQIIAASGVGNNQKIILGRDRGIAGRVMKTGKAEIVNDVSSDPQFIRGGNTIASLMCAPLKAKDAIIGTFNISSQDLYTYRAADLKLLNAIASQTAIALTNARFYEQLTSYSEELKQRNIQLQKEITERQLSEKALKASEERFRTMAESITNGLIILEEGKIVYVNKRACEITGYPQQELMDLWGPDLVVEDETERKDDIIKDIQKTGVWPEQVDTWMHRKEGSKCCVNLRFSFSSKEGDQKYAGYVVITDITERKLAEEKLYKTNMFLDNIIESSLDCIIVGDTRGYLTRINKYSLTLLGYKEEGVLGRHISEFAPSQEGLYESSDGSPVSIDKEYLDKQARMVLLLREEKKISNWEIYLVRKDGKLLPAELNISFLYDDAGKRVGSVGIIRDITERKKAEMQLQETTAFLDNIISNSLDSIVVSDSKGYIQRANRAFFELIDRETNEVLGKQMSQLSVIEEGTYETVYGSKIQIGKEYVDYMMSMLSQFVRDGKISNWESYVIRTDKKVIPVEVSIVSLYNDEGIKSGSVGVVRDITERKKAESEINKTKEFLENIIESSLDPIIIADTGGTIVRANKAFQELLNYENHEIEGMHIGSFAPVQGVRYESRAGTLVQLDDNFFRDADEKMTELVERGALTGWQSCYLGKDGKIIPIEQTIFYLYDNHGERTGVVGISRDITERLKAEQEIVKARDFLQDIIRTSLDGIVVTDSYSTITILNEAAVHILGYPRDELLGKKTQLFLETGDEVEERGKQIQKELMTKGYISGYEHMWVRKDGTVINAEISVALLKDPNSKLAGSVLSIRDITERKRAEKKLIDSQNQLRSLASQLTLTEERERRRIATDLHDRIGQALAISKIKLGALRQSACSLGLDKDVDGIRELIEQTIQDTRSLMFDLCPPFLYELGFEKALEWLLEDIQEQHGIITDFKSEGKPKPLDDDIRVLLYQSVRELFVNIVKHAQAKNARLTVKGDNQSISLCIEDDGRGFDETANPFHMEKQGGFGLFRIQERFQYLGGEIQINSKPGQGTKIFLELPFQGND